MVTMDTPEMPNASATEPIVCKKKTLHSWNLTQTTLP